MKELAREIFNEEFIPMPLWKKTITICLALTGITAMYLYKYCSTACSNLHGTVFNIPLELLGILYAFMVILLTLLTKRERESNILHLLLATLFGAEVYLIGYQVLHATFCPYCLVYGLSIITAFVINFKMDKIKGYFLGAVVGFGSLSIFLKVSMPFYT
ncbi:MAG TPA: vitamin K epoxide reductase family protein [Syntrophorhabdaceae bacterium]|mgnify:FL=1|nr:vitamin K epoxide reductase family protein [Syntrophorhabdaceae bacterium]